MKHPSKLRIYFSAAALSMSLPVGLSDPSVVRFHANQGWAYESDGNMTIEVIRTGDAGTEAQVQFRVADDTARAGVDYIARDGTLRFAPGVMRQSISIVLLDNPRLDGDRRPLLRLRNPFGDYDTATPLVIRDNEVPFMIDPSFRSGITLRNPFGPVQPFIIQPDGGIVAAEPFTSDGRDVWKLMRLHADGSLDSGFDLYIQDLTFDKERLALAGLPDGKILVGSTVETASGFKSEYISRLNADGAVDTSFKCDGGNGDDLALQILTQPDGKILVLGHRLQRFNFDGSHDPTFKNPELPSCVVGSVIALQSDGKVVMGLQSNCTNLFAGIRSGIVRLKADGTLDERFQPDLDYPHLISVILVQSNGQIIIGGGFFSVNGAPRSGVARLNADGSLDSGFEFLEVSSVNFAISSALQLDDKMVASFFWGLPAWSPLQRFNLDGSLDGTFRVPFSGSAAFLPDGKILLRSLSGEFTRVFGNTAGLTGFGFSSDTFAQPHELWRIVPKGSINLVIPVFRYGETAGAATVNYTTRDGTATAGMEYLRQSGTLEFGPLETSQSLAISLNPNASSEVAKTFSVVLSNPSDAGLLAPAREVFITIEPPLVLRAEQVGSETQSFIRLKLWPTVPGALYGIDGATNVNANGWGPGQWEGVQSKTATADMLEFEDIPARDFSQRFYRAVRYDP